MKFLKLKEIHNCIKTNFIKISIGFFVLVCILNTIYTGYVFVITHSWRSPIIIQAPWYKESIKNPVSSRSAGLIPLAYADSNPYDMRSPQGIAWEINKKEFGVNNWDALNTLIENESSWNPYNINPGSGACGLGQSLPCEKMNCEKWDYACQIHWIVDYIKSRYQTPINALIFWNQLHLIEGRWVHYY